MARWLLMNLDRAGKDEFPITHEFLSELLGIRRQTISVIAGADPKQERLKELAAATPAAYTDSVAEPRSTRLRCGRRRLRERTIPSQRVST